LAILETPPLVVIDFFYAAPICKDVSDEADCPFGGEFDHELPDFWLEDNEENLLELYVLAVADEILEVLTEDELDVIDHVV
jgi:hypothetical protein